MQNLKLLIGVIGGTLVVVFAMAYLFTSQEDTGPQQANLALVEGDVRHAQVAQSVAEADTEATSSDNTVAVRIVEFSDFQCPACRATSPLVKDVIEQYPGQVELVYRHFPLETIHPHARLAAIASEVAAQEGQFWEYHDILFANQPEWSEASDPTEMFVGYAQEIGIDTDEFAAKLQESSYDDLVEADVLDGFALGIQGTPTIYVNGYQVNATELSSYVANLLRAG